MQRDETPGRPATQDGPPTDAAQVPTFPGEATTGTGEPDTETTRQGKPQTETTGMSQPVDDERPGEAAAATESGEEDVPQLLTPADEDRFRARWQSVQSKFVDDPREAVRTADTLVAEVMQQLAATFADHKQDLEGQWNRGEQADTEDLRQALRHYRSFFNRLLVT
ncbi:hypothetical protein [Streptomyces xanthii]|uniref:Uncharacterized protein n=1 Tax=Streptomyces xanthii TaxID=2768069 RepID=A0A7H1B1Q0_9ACTN|nr:hypothetical protein [Streptomyces xanthii]QNS02655.1 hypothetical protein IAG42_02820 [Streptomyces xanthii]